MPPDSTNLLQQISHLDQTFIYQLIILITAIVGAITGVISVTRKSRSKQNQKRITSTLEQKFSYSYFPQYATEAATAYYIKPNCSTHDPAQVKEEDIRWLLRQSLFEVIDNFLKSNPKYRHLYILGDSGIGKSSFVLNYFVRNYQRAEKDQCHLIIMPLADPELENWIESIADQENTVLFLDGFDEDTKAIDDPTRRFADLIKLCKRFDRLLITSRSQFFPNDEAIQRETHIRRYVPGAGESSDWEFEIRYLLPFSDQQARDFLRHHYPIWLFFRRRRAFRLMKQIPALSMRPMLLYHIPDLINRKQTIRFTFELYEEMIKAWFIREKRWVDPEALREFSEQLAVEIYSKREERQAEWIHYSELLPLAQNWNIDLQTWKLRSRSLLNRSDPQGNYKFAHRSIMEYLFVKRLLDGAFKYSSLQRTDQMNIFLYEMLKSRHSTISQNDINGYPLKLRSKPSELGEGVIKSMLQKHDFFDKQTHKEGKGVYNFYATHEKNNTSIVTDFATGLMWQQGGSEKRMNFESARQYLQRLNLYKFAGFSGWRLPTLEEAMSLLEKEKKNGELYIDPVFEREQREIWTADKEESGVAWRVRFDSGYCYYTLDADDDHVRAVRSGQ